MRPIVLQQHHHMTQREVVTAVSESTQLERKKMIKTLIKINKKGEDITTEWGGGSYLKAG